MLFPVPCSIFQSTPSSQKVTIPPPTPITIKIISIHTSFAEGDAARYVREPELDISIHTFFAEGDMNRVLMVVESEISIHTSFAEGDEFQFL